MINDQSRYCTQGGGRDQLVPPKTPKIAISRHTHPDKGMDLVSPRPSGRPRRDEQHLPTDRPETETEPETESFINNQATQHPPPLALATTKQQERPRLVFSSLPGKKRHKQRNKNRTPEGRKADRRWMLQEAWSKKPERHTNTTPPDRKRKLSCHVHPISQVKQHRREEPGNSSSNSG